MGKAFAIGVVGGIAWVLGRKALEIGLLQAYHAGKRQEEQS